jgi:hypothetical protein
MTPASIFVEKGLFVPNYFLHARLQAVLGAAGHLTLPLEIISSHGRIGHYF